MLQLFFLTAQIFYLFPGLYFSVYVRFLQERIGGLAISIFSLHFSKIIWIMWEKYAHILNGI